MIKRIFIISVFTIGMLLTPSKAAPNDSLYHLTLTGGFGYGHFFNKFVNVPDDNISNNLPAFVGRIMWEPNHLLKLGLESGYYYLYNAYDIPASIGNDKLSSKMTLVPIFLHVSMNIFDNFYASISSGYSFMRYKVESDEGLSEGTVVSLSNFVTSLSYLYPLSKDWRLGADFRYMYIGETENGYLNLNVFVTFNLLSY